MPRDVIVRPCCNFILLLGLLLLERSEAYGASQAGSASAGSGELNLDFRGRLGSRGMGGRWSKKEEVWIEVKASTAAAATVAAPQASNELTIAVRAKQPIWSIKLSLPERQYCPYDPHVCFGYEFSEAIGSSNQCDIAAWPYDKMALPKSRMQVVDVFREKFIDECTVNNTFGDNGPIEKRRSQMVLTLRQDVPAKMLANSWLVFKIKVKNPAGTPVTDPSSKYLANTWQVVLRSKRGVLGTRVLPAPQILSLWVCSYTKFMWTAPCTARCGGGVRYSVRRLLHPPPPNYPRELLVDCDAPLSKTHACNEEACSVDCALGEWTSFADGPCSVTCGKGFQVERRRVVEGPIGKGKLCPAYNEPNIRVRYKECSMAEECKPKCDLADETQDAGGRLYGGCSEVCLRNHGKRNTMQVIQRKDHSATSTSCGADIKEAQCGVECSTINFFPGTPGRLPRIGKWTEILLVFYLDNNAGEIKLEAPKGFEIGKVDMPDGTKQCMLKDHNIPRLKRCRIQEKKGKMIAVFDLLNALEPRISTHSGGTRQPQYEVRFYVKSPSECEGGFNERGACKGAPGRFDWTMHIISSDYDSYTAEHEKAGFEVYNDHAKEWSPLPHTSSNAFVEDEFLNGAMKEKELSGAETDVEGNIVSKEIASS